MRLLALALLTCAAAATADPPAPAAIPAAAPAAVAAPDPDAAIAARVQTACSGCHAPEILEGKRYSEDQWAAVTDQMISRGAQVSDEEYGAVVTYLTKVYGPDGK